MKKGALQIKAATTVQRFAAGHIHGLINDLSKDKVKEALHERLDFATYDINNFNYKEE